MGNSRLQDRVNFPMRLRQLWLTLLANDTACAKEIKHDAHAHPPKTRGSSSSSAACHR